MKRKRMMAYGLTDGVTFSDDSEKIVKEFIEILFYQAKQRNNLLGKFDDDGNYKLDDPKIIHHLLNIPKKFSEKIDNVVYASTDMEEFVLNFKIEFEISDGYCKATLFLIEIQNNLDEPVKHITKLDECLAVYSPLFDQEVYKLWKVWFDQEIYEKDDYLYSLLHMQEEEMLFNRELTEILSQVYVVRMMAYLDSCGYLGEKIKYEYKLAIEKIFQTDPSIFQDNTRMKFVLDSVLLKNNAFDKIFESSDGLKILANFSAPLKRVKDKVPAVVREGEKSPSKKVAEKKEANKNPKATKAKPKVKSEKKAGKIPSFSWKDVGKFSVSASVPKSKTPDAGKREVVTPQPAAVQHTPSPQKVQSKPADNGPDLSSSLNFNYYVSALSSEDAAIDKETKQVNSIDVLKFSEKTLDK